MSRSIVMQSKSNRVPVVLALAMSGIAAGFSGTMVACRDMEPRVEREPPRVVAPAGNARSLPAVDPGTPAQAAVVKPANDASARAGSLPASPEKGSLPERSVTEEALAVDRLVVTSGVEAREPIASPELKAGGDPIYAFVELKNPADAPGSIVITFEQGDKSVGHIALNVPAKAKRFRTWGRTAQIKSGGEWQAVVRSQGGKELGRTTFSVGS